MKKVLNISSLVLGIASSVLGLLGIITIIMTMADYGFYADYLGYMFLIIVQVVAAVVIYLAIKKDKPLLVIISAVLALILIILDLFVEKTPGMITFSGFFFADLFSSATMLTICDVIGYIIMAAFVAVAALQAYVMLNKKK